MAILWLLDVCMIADVLFTVAVIAIAAGAVTEFQFRIGHIGSTADGTLVGVGFLRFRCGAAGCTVCIGEGNRTGFVDRLLFEKLAHLHSPA